MFTTVESRTSSQYATSAATKRSRGRPTNITNNDTPPTSTPSTQTSTPTKASPNTPYSHHLRKCLGCKDFCKDFLPSYLLIALFPKSLHDYKEKCIKCRRSIDAVGDYVKTHGDANGDLTLEKQLNHLQTQREVLERWKATLARMGVVIEDELIVDGMSHVVGK